MCSIDALPAARSAELSMTGSVSCSLGGKALISQYSPLPAAPVDSSEPSCACLSLNDRLCDFELPVSLVILCRAGLRRNAMKPDGFPNAVAVALALALAFAVSLFAAFAFGGLP